MVKISKHTVTRFSGVVVIVPFFTVLVLAPYALLLGWNLLTAFLFWFIIVPGLSLFLNAEFFKTKINSWRAMVSMTIFYAFMVFMTYKHFETDFFAVMMLSFLWNLLIMVVVMLIEGDHKRSAKQQGLLP